MKLNRISSAIASLGLIVFSGTGIIASTVAIAPPAQAQATGKSVSTLRGCFIDTPFTGRIAYNPTRIRLQPTTASDVVGQYTRIDEVVQYNGIVTGETLPDSWDGKPDNMWYRLPNNRGYMASAVIKGYPPQGNCSTTPPTTAQKILDAVKRANPEVNYRPDTYNTYCNWFVADVLKILNVELPRVAGDKDWQIYPSPVFGRSIKPFLAEDLYRYFNAGGNGKWRSVDAATAVSRANQGGIVVASIDAPPGGKDGHIAIVIPGGTGTNVRIAQAGARNGSNLSVQEGFGSRTPRYFENIK
jgi:hypothetical protein